MLSNSGHAQHFYDSSSNSGGTNQGTTPGSSCGLSNEGEGGTGQQAGDLEAEVEMDPFLSLLEQLVENEGGRGGPSDLDYFIGTPNGGNGI